MTLVSYPRLVDSVRRFRPADLLPALAREGAANFDLLVNNNFDIELAARQTSPPWDLAELAKISLTCGN